MEKIVDLDSTEFFLDPSKAELHLEKIAKSYIKKHSSEFIELDSFCNKAYKSFKHYYDDEKAEDLATLIYYFMAGQAYENNDMDYSYSPYHLYGGKHK